MGLEYVGEGRPPLLSVALSAVTFISMYILVIFYSLAQQAALFVVPCCAGARFIGGPLDRVTQCKSIIW